MQSDVKLKSNFLGWIFIIKLDELCVIHQLTGRVFEEEGGARDYVFRSRFNWNRHSHQRTMAQTKTTFVWLYDSFVTSKAWLTDNISRQSVLSITWKRKERKRNKGAACLVGVKSFSHFNESQCPIRRPKKVIDKTTTKKTKGEWPFLYVYLNRHNTLLKASSYCSNSPHDLTRLDSVFYLFLNNLSERLRK